MTRSHQDKTFFLQLLLLRLYLVICWDQYIFILIVLAKWFNKFMYEVGWICWKLMIALGWWRRSAPLCSTSLNHYYMYFLLRQIISINSYFHNQQSIIHYFHYFRYLRNLKISSLIWSLGMLSPHLCHLDRILSKEDLLSLMRSFCFCCFTTNELYIHLLKHLLLSLCLNAVLWIRILQLRSSHPSIHQILSR